MSASLSRRIRRLPLNNTWASEKDLERLALQLRQSWKDARVRRRTAKKAVRRG